MFKKIQKKSLNQLKFGYKIIRRMRYELNDKRISFENL